MPEKKISEKKEQQGRTSAGALLAAEKRIRQERARWCVTYEMIRRVRDEELWRFGGYQNFTFWLAAAAEKTGMDKSELWKRYGAGSAYEGFLSREKAAGRNGAPALSELTVSPNTVVLAYRVAGKENTLLGDRLMREVLAGRLTRKGLDDAWKTARKTKKTASDRKKAGKTAEPGEQRNRNFQLETALSLSVNAGTFLLGGEAPAKRSRFRVLSELMSTGENFPLLVIENLTTGAGSPMLHGIRPYAGLPLSVAEQLKREESYPFDFLWLAVQPGNDEEFQRMTAEYLPESGILIVSPKAAVIRVLRNAKRLLPDAEKRLALMSEAAVRLMEPAP